MPERWGYTYTLSVALLVARATFDQLADVSRKSLKGHRSPCLSFFLLAPALFSSLLEPLAPVPIEPEIRIGNYPTQLNWQVFPFFLSLFAPASLP